MTEEPIIYMDAGADICLAFLKRSAQNRGTLDCMNRARKAGIEGCRGLG